MNDEIASKLEMLEGYIAILKGYQHYDVEDLMCDHTLRGSGTVHRGCTGMYDRYW